MLNSKRDLSSCYPGSQCLVDTSRLDYCNSIFRSLSSFNMRKLQCIQNTLARIVTNCNKYTRASPILKQLPVEFRCIFKTATLVYKFLHNGYCSYFGPLCLLVEDIVQDITIQIEGFWRFLNSVHLYINQKITLATALLLMLPWFGIICLMKYVLPPTLACFRKRLKSYLFKKAFPT